MAEKQFYPMMPERSWWTLRQQFKKTIPTALSVSYLKSLLGLTSDQSARNLLSPLKQMKIIDDEGKPLPRANDWRNDDKYSIVCQEILKDIYPSELLDLFPEKDVDASSVKNWFMDVCAIGASAAGKNATTFVMLKSGNIKDFSNIKTSTTKIAKPKTTLIQKSNNAITLHSKHRLPLFLAVKMKSYQLFILIYKYIFLQKLQTLKLMLFLPVWQNIYMVRDDLYRYTLFCV